MLYQDFDQFTFPSGFRFYKCLFSMLSSVSSNRGDGFRLDGRLDHLFVGLLFIKMGNRVPVEFLFSEWIVHWREPKDLENWNLPADILYEFSRALE